MNGEIKIRAWSTANKVMYYDKNVSVLAKNLKDDNVWKYMLWTGFYDEYGTPIYQGDILEDRVYSGTYEVKFESGAFTIGKNMLLGWALNGSYDIDGVIPENGAEFTKVIGHIYEEKKP